MLSELPVLVREEKLASDEWGSSKNFGIVELPEDSLVSRGFRVLFSENLISYTGHLNVGLDSVLNNISPNLVYYTPTKYSIH